MATAKQRAWRIKFGNMAKAGKFRSKTTRRVKTRRSKGVSMARKGRGRSKGGRGNIIMKGVFGSKIPFGIVGLVAAGYIYSKFVSPSVPKIAGNMQTAVTESAVIGGVPMALGAFVANGMNLGSSSSSTTDSSTAW